MILSFFFALAMLAAVLAHIYFFQIKPEIEKKHPKKLHIKSLKKVIEIIL